MSYVVFKDICYTIVYKGGFVTSCLIFCAAKPFFNASSLKGKTMLPTRQNSFPLEYTPFQNNLPCKYPFPI